jgi:hypothetical protein
MEDTKPWWQSRTIWASILQVLIGIGVSFGLFSQAAGETILSQGPDLIVGIGVSIVGVLQVVSRVKATKQIG